MLQNTSNTLNEQQVNIVLERLFKSAKSDKYALFRFAPRFLMGFLQGKSINDTLTPAAAKNIYMPISQQQGKFLYQTARAIGAKTIVEFGTSFGISTIYLASAVKDNGGGIVIGTELEPYKHNQAVQNLTEACLHDFTDIRLGDARETLQKVPQPIDMVFLDGWKDLYLPVLHLLEQKLRLGAIVLADNIFTFKKSLMPYTEYMQSEQKGLCLSHFQSVKDWSILYL